MYIYKIRLSETKQTKWDSHHISNERMGEKHWVLKEEAVIFVPSLLVLCEKDPEKHW